MYINPLTSDCAILALEPKRLTCKEEYEFVCADISAEVFTIAGNGQAQLTRAEHAWLTLSSISLASTSLLSKVAWIGLRMLAIISRLFAQQWKDAAYNFCCVLILDPLAILGSIASSQIRIFSSILGIALPQCSLPAWSMAESIDRDLLALKFHLLEYIDPDAPNIGWGTDESRARATEDIKPESALIYFGRERCHALFLRDEETYIELTDLGIRSRVACLLKDILEQDPQRLSSLLNLQAFSRGQMERDDPMRPILEKLFPTRPDRIEKLPDICSLISVDEARLLYEHISDELIMPGSETRREERGLTETSEVWLQMRSIELLLKSRFAFGRVSYQLH